MKPIAGMIAALSLCLALPAAAQEPDLTGTWTATEGALRTTAGTDLVIGPTSALVITIVSQNGPLLSGTYAWAHPESTRGFTTGHRRPTGRRKPMRRKRPVGACRAFKPAAHLSPIW